MDKFQNYSISDGDCIPQRDTENEYAEWFHDAPSEAEWVQNDITRSTACSLSESINSTNILDELYEKNKIMERNWKEADNKYRNLKVENQKLFIQLSNERYRANRYQKKLQFIQDNQEIFNRLKQAYLYMKYNEATGRTMVEIRERACQTWEGILCDACIGTAETIGNEDLERLRASTENALETVTVKKSDLLTLKQTVQMLKEMIDRREKSWSYNAERENKYKASILDLQEKVKILSNLITSEQTGIIAPLSSESNAELIVKENAFFRKIIVKLEKRQRELEKRYKLDKTTPLLSADDKNTVRQLIRKYANKLNHKSTILTGETDNIPKTKTPRTSNSIITPAVNDFIGFEDGVGDRIGAGEGTTGDEESNVCPVLLHSQEHNIEIAEKPFPMNNEDIVQQVNVLDLYVNSASTSS